MFNLNIRADGKVFTNTFNTLEEAENYGEVFIRDWNKKNNFISATNNSWSILNNRRVKLFSGETFERIVRGSMEIIEK